MSNTSEPSGSGAPRAADITAGAVIIVIAIAAIAVSRGFPMTGAEVDVGPGRFPLIYAGVLIVLSMILIVQALRRRPSAAGADASAPINPVRIITGIIATGVYIVAISYLGYVPTTIVFLIGTMRLMGMRHIVWGPVIAVAMTAFLYIVFVYGLSVPLPLGSLFEDAGLL